LLQEMLEHHHRHHRHRAPWLPHNLRAVCNRFALLAQQACYLVALAIRQAVYNRFALLGQQAYYSVVTAALVTSKMETSQRSQAKLVA
jgi:hypothetical protein